MRDLVEWVETGGFDFVFRCGSTGEAALLTAGEGWTVIQMVADEASVPVLAVYETHRPGPAWHTFTMPTWSSWTTWSRPSSASRA